MNNCFSIFFLQNIYQISTYSRNFQIFRQDHEKRIGFDEIFATLTNYVFDNLSSFPAPEDLFVNKISGVKRKAIITVNFNPFISRRC